MKLPEGFVIKKQKSKADRIKELQEHIKRLEAVAPDDGEPTPEEVIETAKMCLVHPYYEARSVIDMLKQEINNLK